LTRHFSGPIFEIASPEIQKVFTKPAQVSTPVHHLSTYYPGGGMKEKAGSSGLMVFIVVGLCSILMIVGLFFDFQKNITSSDNSFTHFSAGNLR
jgi:hypothetical protein